MKHEMVSCAFGTLLTATSKILPGAHCGAELLAIEIQAQISKMHVTTRQLVDPKPLMKTLIYDSTRLHGQVVLPSNNWEWIPFMIP